MGCFFGACLSPGPSSSPTATVEAVNRTRYEDPRHAHPRAVGSAFLCEGPGARLRLRPPVIGKVRLGDGHQLGADADRAGEDPDDPEPPVVADLLPDEPFADLLTVDLI